MSRGSLAFPFFVCTFFIAFAGSLFADSLGDPFDGTSLKNPNWKWQNEPAKWDVGMTKEGWLHITGENNQNLWQSDTSARLYQEVSADDLDIETHLVMEYQNTTSLVAGLVIKGPKEDNWVTMKCWGRDANTQLQWQHKGEEVNTNVPGAGGAAGTLDMFIRIVKKSDEYIGYWKKNEGDAWNEIVPHANRSLTPPLEVGIFTGICTAGGTATMEFEYFEDLVNPFLAVASGGKLASCWAAIKSE